MPDAAANEQAHRDARSVTDAARDHEVRLRAELGPELHAELAAANAEDLALFEQIAGLYGLGAALAKAS